MCWLLQVKSLLDLGSTLADGVDVESTRIVSAIGAITHQPLSESPLNYIPGRHKWPISVPPLQSTGVSSENMLTFPNKIMTDMNILVRLSLIGQGWMDIFNNTTPIELNERVCLQKGAYMFQPFEKLVYIMPKS